MSNEVRKEIMQSVLIAISIAVAFCAFVLFSYFISQQSKQSEENRKQRVIKEAEELLKQNQM